MFRRLFPYHADSILAFALFAMALGVYLRTLCPTLYWGDCGELVSAAYGLGITHPTGYPVWTLLGHAWLHLFPFGNIAWRLNILSAVFGALAVAALYGCARTLALPRMLALTVAGLFAFSHTFWQQCLFAETYSLTAFYACLLLFLAARWRARGCQTRDLRLLAVAYGFALTNHLTNALFLPGFVVFVLWSDPALRKVRERSVRRIWAGTLAMGAAPLLFYLYLPLRARMHPLPNWGDPATPFAFAYHVTGRFYGPAMFHSSWADILHRLGHWGLGLGSEYAWPVIALAELGLFSLWRRAGDRPLAFLLTWIIVANVAYTINYAIYNSYIYFIPSYLVLSLSIGRGLLSLWRRLERALAETKRPAYAALASACVIALVPLQALGHWQKNDLSHVWTCYDYGQNLLATAPLNSVIVENGDDTAASAMTYLQIVEGRRRDVVVIQRGILAYVYDPFFHRWANAWYLQQLAQRYPPIATLYPHGTVTAQQALDEDILNRLLLDSVGHNRPTFMIQAADTSKVQDAHLPASDPTEFTNQHFASARIGLLVRLYPKSHPPSDRDLLAETQQVWQRYQLRGVYDGLYADDDFLTPIALAYANGGLAHARLAYTLGNYDDAESSYRNVTRLFGSSEAEMGLRLCAAARGRVASQPSP